MIQADTKLYDPSKRKMGLPCFEKTRYLNIMKMPWYFMYSFLSFCLEPTVTNDICIRTTSVYAMVIIISKVFFMFH